MAYLLAFAPWLTFAVIPGADWTWAAVIALAVSVVGIVRQTRGGLPLDAQIIAIGSAAYFAGLAALALADPHTALHAYTAAMASGALGLIGAGLPGGPEADTLGIAKQDIPREHWDDPMFFTRTSSSPRCGRPASSSAASCSHCWPTPQSWPGPPCRPPRS